MYHENELLLILWPKGSHRRLSLPLNQSIRGTYSYKDIQYHLWGIEPLDLVYMPQHSIICNQCERVYVYTFTSYCAQSLNSAFDNLYDRWYQTFYTRLVVYVYFTNNVIYWNVWLEESLANLANNVSLAKTIYPAIYGHCAN